MINNDSMEITSEISEINIKEELYNLDIEINLLFKLIYKIILIYVELNKIKYFLF